jgi:hypothetical protein
LWDFGDWAINQQPYFKRVVWFNGFMWAKP